MANPDVRFLDLEHKVRNLCEDVDVLGKRIGERPDRSEIIRLVSTIEARLTKVEKRLDALTKARR